MKPLTPNSSPSSEVTFPLTPPVNVASTKELLRNMIEESRSLSTIFGELQKQTMQIASQGDPKTTQEINELLVQMEDQERMHTEGIAEIHLILNKHLQTQFFEHLKEQAQQEIDREIHELVRDQVALCLEAHISQELQDEVARNRRELEDLRLQLHNSESRRANSLLRSNQPNDPLHTIYTSNGQVSAHFPKSLGDLFNLDAETCRCLVLDYELPVSDSRDRNLNLFMRFCGVGYQVVR